MSKLHNGILFVAAVFSSSTARSQSGTVTLTSGLGAYFFTNTTSSAGGDLTFAGARLAFQAGTDGGEQDLAVDLTVLAGSKYSGQSAFNQLIQSQLSQFVNQYNILASSGYSGLTSPVAVGDILMVVIDSGAALVKVLVTAVSASSATLQYQCYGSLPYVPPLGTPVITSILNNYNYIPEGFLQYGIAPSSLFIIQGTNLANTGSPTALQSSASPGLPLTLNGASISIDANGTTIHPAIYYATPTQIAAVLPANTPQGYLDLTVLAPGGTSFPHALLVADVALGLASYYGTGGGPAVATDPATGALFTPANSTRPGQTIVLWGSGLGADPSVSDTTFTTPTQSVGTPLQIFIGGVQASVSYHGSSGYPGVNQINVTIPDSVLPGCSVSVVAVSGSAVSNTLSLPISATGGNCSDPAFGVSGLTLAALSAQSNVFVGQFSVSSAGASGVFQMMSGANFALSMGIGSLGSCSVTNNPALVSTSQGVDVGNVTATDSAGSFPFTLDSTGVYRPPTLFSIPLGTPFSFQGSGNTFVGSFTTSLTLPAASLAWTNQNSSVRLSSDFNVTWSGSAPGTVMLISGIVGSGSRLVEFTCYASANAGQFTVPVNILRALPPFAGGLMLQNLTYVPFSASGLGTGLTVLSISQVHSTVSYY